MKIAICDDLKSDMDNLLSQIRQYEEENHKIFDIHMFYDGNDFLNEFKTDAYQVIFLDIYIDKISGIDIAREIRKIDENVRIIFTTTSTEFFREGFEVDATNYLVKPVQYDNLTDTMHRLKNLFDDKDDILIIPDPSEQIPIPQHSIVYIETIRNGVRIHFQDKFMEFRYSLAKVEKQLNPEYFLRTHRSYIVNFNYVKDINDDSFIMKNGSEVLIKQKDKASIRQKYADFYLKKLSGEY